MALEYIASQLERQAQANLRSQERRILRHMEDPFDLSDREFMTLYRLKKDTIYEIIDAIRSHLEPSRITGISPEKMALSSIRFYATGGFQRPIGEHWGISLSQSSTVG
ncbi:uncharacterized protein [Musca autumnalis]|uniref:uncharacterized protein n=1 Tax=Musca autumnalis TaxID=221902 RepID=UPI003CEFE55C